MTTGSFYYFENNQFKHVASLSHDCDPLFLHETIFDAFQNFLESKTLKNYKINVREIADEPKINQVSWLFCFNNDRIFFHHTNDVWLDLQKLIYNYNNEESFEELLNKFFNDVKGENIWINSVPSNVSFRP